MIIGRIVLRIGFLDIGCTKTVFRKLDFLGLFICYQRCFRLTSLIFWPCSEFFLGINAFLTNYPGLNADSRFYLLNTQLHPRLTRTLLSNTIYLYFRWPVTKYSVRVKFVVAAGPNISGKFVPARPKFQTFSARVIFWSAFLARVSNMKNQEDPDQQFST